MNGELALCFLAALSFSIFGVLLALRIARRLSVVDVPSHRSSHSAPIPRGGGLGVQIGVGASALVFFLLGNRLPGWPFWSGTGLMLATGLLDDIKGGLPATARLLFQSVAAALVIAFSGRLLTLPLPSPLDASLGWSGAVISFIWIIAVINFFNFMDGIDGIAGSQAVVTGITLAVILPGEYRWLGLSIAGSSLGFLVFNWQPAKIFMGDVGSYSLGFMLAASPFLGGSESSSPVAMLVGLSLWMFLADASFTLLKRLFSKERVWEAHRTHLYQRLVISGLSHRDVTLLVGAGAVIVSASAAIAYRVEKAWMWWLAFAVAFALSLTELSLAWYREKLSSRLESGGTVDQ